MLKRLFAFAVSMALIVGMVPAIVFADEAGQQPDEPAAEASETTETDEEKEQEDSSEEKLSEETAKVSAKAKAKPVDPYVFNGTTMTINKNIPNYNAEDEVPWKDYRNSIKKVVVNKGVTSIGDYAFSKCESLESVSLPAGLKTIGKKAFI